MVKKIFILIFVSCTVLHSNAKSNEIKGIALIAEKQQIDSIEIMNLAEAYYSSRKDFIELKGILFTYFSREDRLDDFIEYKFEILYGQNHFNSIYNQDNIKVNKLTYNRYRLSAGILILSIGIEYNIMHVISDNEFVIKKMYETNLFIDQNLGIIISKPEGFNPYLMVKINSLKTKPLLQFGLTYFY